MSSENRRHSDIVITIVPRRNLKIYHYVNSFQDRDFSKFGTRCSKSGRNSSIDPPTIPFSRVIYSKFRSTCQMQRIDHSRVKFVSLPPQLKMHRKYTLWTNDARGQRETISSAPEIPASLPHYGSIVGYNRRFFLNEQYRPKIYRRISRSLFRARMRETCSRQFDTNSRLTREESKKKKKERKSKKKRSINQRNVSTRMHRCTRSLRGNKQANIKISRGWNGKRE